MKASVKFARLTGESRNLRNAVSAVRFRRKAAAEINPASTPEERLMRLRRENIFAAAKKGERRMNLRRDFLFCERGLTDWIPMRLAKLESPETREWNHNVVHLLLRKEMHDHESGKMEVTRSKGNRIYYLLAPGIFIFLLKVVCRRTILLCDILHNIFAVCPTRSIILCNIEYCTIYWASRGCLRSILLCYILRGNTTVTTGTISHF